MRHFFCTNINPIKWGRAGPKLLASVAFKMPTTTVSINVDTAWQREKGKERERERESRKAYTLTYHCVHGRRHVLQLNLFENAIENTHRTEIEKNKKREKIA